MKPKHLFYGLAAVAMIVAVVCTIQRSFGMALVAALMGTCAMLNTTRPGADRTANRRDVKRFFGIR